jgi:hypothetical protein
MAVFGNVNRMSQQSLTDGNLNFLSRMSAVVARDCHFIQFIPMCRGRKRRRKVGKGNEELRKMEKYGTQT